MSDDDAISIPQISVPEISAPEISVPEGHAALQQLKESLSEQYGQMPAGQVSDMIDQRLDKIDPVLTALNQAGMASGTVAISAAAAALTNPIKDLDALKKQIQSINDDVGKAAQVLGGVDQFISGVKSYFGV